MLFVILISVLAYIAKKNKAYAMLGIMEKLYVPSEEAFVLLYKALGKSRLE